MDSDSCSLLENGATASGHDPNVANVYAEDTKSKERERNELIPSYGPEEEPIMAPPQEAHESILSSLAIGLLQLSPQMKSVLIVMALTWVGNSYFG